jgi:hypothetical protein
MPKFAALSFLPVWALFHPARTMAQGETTSAIAGQVRDESGASISNARVAIIGNETSLRRGVLTDIAAVSNSRS